MTCLLCDVKVNVLDARRHVYKEHRAKWDELVAYERALANGDWRGLR
jgi:hypothetical protein